MSKILSIGAGVMGTAITVPAVSNGHEAKLVGTNFDEDIINSINKNSSHPKLGIKLTNTSAIRFNEMSQEDINESEVIVVGISSSGVDWFIDFIQNFNVTNKHFLIVTKVCILTKKRS